MKIYIIATVKEMPDGQEVHFSKAWYFFFEDAVAALKACTEQSAIMEFESSGDFWNIKDIGKMEEKK